MDIAVMLQIVNILSYNRLHMFSTAAHLVSAHLEFCKSRVKQWFWHCVL